MRCRVGIHVLAAGAALIYGGSRAAGSIVFDDFNADEGHFVVSPTFAGQTLGLSTTSTADRITTDSPLEGAGQQKIVLVHDGSANNPRSRHLSGGSTSATAGNPANNVTFTTSSGTDGFIGFYMKTTAQGFTVGLNLDDSTNTGAGMDMGHVMSLNSDGQWHLYEWNLDDDTQWDAVPSIGGNGTIEAGQHSIDSIYIFGNHTGANGDAEPPIYLDFVAKSDSGSIAALVPAPEPSGALVVSALGVLFLRRRPRHRQVM